MDVTVIVVTVGGPWLNDQLAALAAQTRQAEQLILVNNGTPGVVDDVVARWRAEMPALELIEDDEIAAPAHARNVGARAARHEGLVFVDDDDVVSPGYVAAMSAALDDHDLIAARVDLQRLNPPELVHRWGAMQAQGPMTYHDFLPWSISAACAVRRSTFEKIGGFDTALTVVEDTDFSWRAQLDAHAIVAFAPDAVLSYRLRTKPAAAFRQARLWASWEPALYKRYASKGLRRSGNPLRPLLRWGRPVLLLARARKVPDLVVAAREFGGCLGRLEGSIRHRHMHL